MAGIYGLLNPDFSKPELYKDFYNYQFSGTTQRQISHDNIVFGRSVLDKGKDRFLYEDTNYILCFEGLNYSSINTPEHFIQQYLKKGSLFIKQLRGVFCGFIFSKKEQKLVVFNDPLATKSIYYYHNEKQGLAFSSEMHTLSKYLRSNDNSLSYNLNGIYSLALYGQLFDNQTIVKEITRLGAASILTYDLASKKLKIDQYHKFKRDISSVNKRDIIETFDHLMLKAVTEEWEKDTTNGYHQHLTLISGGMDSRVNALLAKEIGFKPINGFTYGYPQSDDVKIAQTIAAKNFDSHFQYNLFNGDIFLNNILEHYIKPTDGLTPFTANAIIYNAFNKLNRTDFASVHSGQLGDTITGSFLKPNFDFIANADKIGLNGFVKNKALLKKITNLDQLLERYQGSDYDLFTYEQRQINGTLAGDRMVSNFIDQVSPFYDLALIDFILTLPADIKINQRIYFYWLREKHPEILHYKWEKIGLKPTNSFNINYGKLYRKYLNGGKKYFGLNYDSMNPIGTWFSRTPHLLANFDSIFNSHINTVTNKELQKDLRQIYHDDVFEYRNKFSVITVLLALKLHFE